MGDVLPFAPQPVPCRHEVAAWRSPAAPLRMPIPQRGAPPLRLVAGSQPVPSPILDAAPIRLDAVRRRPNPYRPFPLVLDIAWGLAAFLVLCALSGGLVIALVALWRATQP